MTSHYTRGSVTTRHDFLGVLGRPLSTLILSLTIFMVTAFGSCVKWPINYFFTCLWPYQLKLANWACRRQSVPWEHALGT